MKRLGDALHKLFHPPPEGIPDRIYVTDRNDTSAQIRSRLAVNQSEIGDLAEMRLGIEVMDVELRELNQKLKQMQQNTAAFKRGAELHVGIAPLSHCSPTLMKQRQFHLR